MKILLFIAIGFIAGYISKDLLTKESEVIYNIRRLRAKKGGEVSVNADVIIETKTGKERRKKRREDKLKNK
ncbi:MAG TPA: hypothetical protein ENH85_02255 [Candidatus Scalindua sp.]|nr:hypothetical protein [Candidatus Scalindua sp.]